MPKAQALSGQSRTVSQPPRLPLIPMFDTRTSITPLTKDARLLNGYVERDPNNQDSYWIYKRLGLNPTPTYSVGAAVGRGMLLVNNYDGTGDVYTVFNDTLYSNGTSVGTLSTSTGPVRITPIPPIAGTGADPTFPAIMIYDGTYGYYYTSSGSASGLHQLGAGNTFTTNPIVPGFVFADSYVYIMDVYGNIWGTQDQNDPRVWPALDVIVAGNEPSPGVALAKQLAYVIALKQNSTQVFYTAGGVATTVGSPLGNIPEAQLPWGCLNGYTVATIDEILFWITANATVSPQVMRMENLAARVCSTPQVDRILNNIAWSANTYGGVFAWTLKLDGHRWYFLTCVYLNITLVYDIDQNYWSFWTDQNENYWPYIGMTCFPVQVGASGQHIIQHLSNGNVYAAAGADVYPNDAGTIVPVDLYTPNFDANIDRRKMLNMMRFNADQTAGSLLQIRHSDDDYQTWSNFREVDLGLERPFIDREGTFRRRAYHMRHAVNTSLRIKSVDLTMDIGTL